MGQFITESMSRLVLAGTREQLTNTVRVVADLGAVHINDYTGEDDGLSLGKPEDDSESVSRRLTRFRGCASLVEPERQTTLLPAVDVRSNLKDSIDALVDESISRFEEIDTQVLGIGTDSKPAQTAFATGLGGIPYPILSDFHPQGEVTESFGVLNSERGTPLRAVIIIDKNGVVRFAKTYESMPELDIDYLIAELNVINNS